MSQPTRPEVTVEFLRQLAFGYAPPLILEAAINHRVFDTLDSGPKTVEQVHAESGASIRGLRAIMNALTSLGFLDKNDGVYSNTEGTSRFLVLTRPSYQGGLLSHTSSRLLPSWLKINDVVATGLPARAVNSEEVGVEFFRQLVVDLFPMNYPAARTLAADLGLSSLDQSYRVLDIAAGSGVWGIGLAQESEHVHVTAVDFAPVLDVTRVFAERFGLAGRFSYIPGDLLESDYGGGYQAVLLGHILHSEGEERSRRLLQKVFDALAPGGIVVIAEMVANDDHSGPPNATIFAVNMLTYTDVGDTFSLSEMNGWLAEIGYVGARTIEIPGPSPLLVASKP